MTSGGRQAGSVGEFEVLKRVYFGVFWGIRPVWREMIGMSSSPCSIFKLHTFNLCLRLGFTAIIQTFHLVKYATIYISKKISVIRHQSTWNHIANFYAKRMASTFWSWTLEFTKQSANCLHIYQCSIIVNFYGLIFLYMFYEVNCLYHNGWAHYKHVPKLRVRRDGRGMERVHPVQLKKLPSVISSREMTTALLRPAAILSLILPLKLQPNSPSLSNKMALNINANNVNIINNNNKGNKIRSNLNSYNSGIRKRKLPVLLFDVMDTIVRDPFYHDVPAFFG